MIQISLRALRKGFILYTLSIRWILKVESEYQRSEEGQPAREGWPVSLLSGLAPVSAACCLTDWPDSCDLMV